MKKVRVMILMFVSTISMSAIAQNIGDYIDVVHLKNGSMIKGIIVEQIPGKSVRIKTKDGSEYVYLETEVEKYTREEKIETSKKGKDNPLSYINNYKRKGKGYFFEAEALLSNAGSGFRITNGYRFNRFAKLGVAFGAESLNSLNPVYYGQYQVQRVTANLVFSGDILDKRITPFYQVEIGYGFDPNKQYYNYGNTDGQMLGAMFGVRFKTKKKIEYKLGLDLRISKTNSFSGVVHQPYAGVRFGIGF